MAKTRADMQRLGELRARLVAEIAERERGLHALQNKLLGIDAAIAAINGDTTGLNSSVPTSRRRNVTRTVMEIIEEAGANGVTAGEVLDRAAAKGKTLDRASVSSLLSRNKREGLLTFDGERYHVASSQGPQPTLKVV
jgi:hypothetical protein